MAKSEDLKLKKLPVGAIRPQGWLLDEMLLMSNLQKRLGALQGLVKNGEWVSGENLPRYVRGLILLAGALDDKNLKDKVESFVRPILNGANAGGDFGPKKFRSLTPKIEGIKALLSYYELSGDETVLQFLKRFFKNQFNSFAVSPCWYDSRARLLEEIPAIETVYRETDLEWLQDLGEKLRDASNDWFRLATKFPYKKPYSRYVSATAVKLALKTVDAYENTEQPLNAKLKPLTPEKIEKEWKKSTHQILVETNGVNLAKAVKYPAVYGRFVGDEELKGLSLKLLSHLEKYHGTAAGMFASDFHLAGANPSRGIDICASVEMMESLLEVIKETGEYSLADVMERIAFNVIPGACTEDATAVQDILLVNEVEASNKRKLPYSESEIGNAYVTKKLARGAIAVLSAFPTFMQLACMVREDELNFLTYTPCIIDVNVCGAKLRLKETTSYPFRNTVVFKVEQAEGEPEVKINFRVPNGTTMQLVSGGQVVATGARSISVKCVLKTGSTFMLKMDIPLLSQENRDGSVSLFKGNVLMATKMPYECAVSAEDRRIINLNFVKKWNVAPILSKKAVGGVRQIYEAEKTTVNPIGEIPFSFGKPPFELKIRSKNVVNWDYNLSGFTEIPQKPVFSEESLERVYMPFGCSMLHIAQFPKCLK